MVLPGQRGVGGRRDRLTTWAMMQMLRTLSAFCCSWISRSGGTTGMPGGGRGRGRGGGRGCDRGRGRGARARVRGFTL
jgi:hypothetical protein